MKVCRNKMVVMQVLSYYVDEECRHSGDSRGSDRFNVGNSVP